MTDDLVIRKVMFYLTTQSIHFYLQLCRTYDEGPLCEREDFLPLLDELLFPISITYMHHPADRIVHTTTFATSVVGHLLGIELFQ